MTLLVSTVFSIPITIVSILNRLTNEKASMKKSLKILVTELVRYKLNLDDDRPIELFGWDVPIVAQNLYKFIGYFLFGAAVCQLTTDIAKYSVGRLRPHFISVSLLVFCCKFDLYFHISLKVCRPVMDDGGDCTDMANLHKYIENFKCSNPEATDHMLKDMRLSFPSGHASIAFFTMLFCSVSFYFGSILGK